MSMRLARSAGLIYATDLFLNVTSFFGTGVVARQIEDDLRRNGKHDSAYEFCKTVHRPVIEYDVSLFNPAAFAVRYRVFFAYGEQFIQNKKNREVISKLYRVPSIVPPRNRLS